MDSRTPSQSYGPVVPRSSAVSGRAEAGVPIGPYLLEMLDPFQSDCPPVPDGVMNGIVKKLTWTKSLTGKSDYVFLLYPNRLGENIFVGARVLDPILGKPGIGLRAAEDPSDLIDAQYDMGAVISAGLKARSASAPIGNTALNGTIVAGSIPSTVMPAAFDPDSVIALDPQTEVRNTPTIEGVVLRGSCNGVPLYEKPHYLQSTSALDTRDINLSLELSGLIGQGGTSYTNGFNVASTINAGDASADFNFPGHLGRMNMDINVGFSVAAAVAPNPLTFIVTTLDENGAEQTILNTQIPVTYIHGTIVANSIYTARAVVSFYAKRPVYRMYIVNTTGQTIVTGLTRRWLVELMGTFFREVPLKIAHIANIDAAQQVTFEATVVTYLKPATALAKELMPRVRPIAHEYQAFISACEIAHTFPSVFTLGSYNAFCSSWASYPSMSRLTDANYVSGRASWITDIGDYAKKALRRFGPKVIDYGADWLKGQLSGSASEAKTGSAFRFVRKDAVVEQRPLNARKVVNFIGPGRQFIVRGDKDTISTFQGENSAIMFIDLGIPFVPPIQCKQLRVYANRSIYWYDRNELLSHFIGQERMLATVTFSHSPAEFTCHLLRRRQTKKKVPRSPADPMDTSAISGSAAPLMCVPFASLTDAQKVVVYAAPLYPSTNFFRGTQYTVFDPDLASDAQKAILIDAVSYPPPNLLRQGISGRASEAKANMPDLGADDFKVPPDDGMENAQDDPLAEPDRPPETHVEPTGVMVASEASVLSLVGAAKAQIGLDAHGGIFGGGSSSTAFFPLVYDQDGARRCKVVMLVVTQEPLTLVNGGRLQYSLLEGNEDSPNRVYINHSFNVDDSGLRKPAMPIGGVEDVAA